MYSLPMASFDRWRRAKVARDRDTRLVGRRFMGIAPPGHGRTFVHALGGGAFERMPVPGGRG